MDFGEVVTTSSRAFWNDYEELEASRTQEESLSLDYGSSTPEHIATQLSTVETLLCIEGTATPAAVIAFVNAAILQNGAQQLFAVAGCKVTVHLLADGRTAVLLSGEHDLMAFGGIAQLLVELLGNIGRVYTLSVEPAVAYKAAGNGNGEGNGEADRKESCFVRGLRGDGGQLLDGVRALAEPNLLTGVAAGIVSWRKFRALPWTCYVAYVNEPKMNSLTTAPILQLVRRLGVACAATYSERVCNESNLYT